MFDLKSFFAAHEVVLDGPFERLGTVETKEPRSLAFAENDSYLERALANPNVSALILATWLYDSNRHLLSKPAVVVEHPRFRYWTLHNLLVEQNLIGLSVEPRRGTDCSIHPSAVVGSRVAIGDQVSIGANAVIEDGTVIKDGAVISPGAVIGAQGMQFTPLPGGSRLFIRHAGGVKLGRNVHVLSNAIVSRAVDPSYTSIGDDTIISLLVSVGHNSRIGERCSIAGNVLIGGSVIIGDDVWVGPSVTIKDGVTIGAKARLILGAVVIENVGEGQAVSGNFALPHSRNLQAYVKARM
jgi:UDP-3-O-[3-hydroxymyristoyl] glucosamine N-acyltransferase